MIYEIYDVYNILNPSPSLPVPGGAPNVSELCSFLFLPEVKS